MGVLSDILASKRNELAELRQRKLPAPPDHRPSFSLRRDGGDGLRLLCEIKRRSPSAGMLSTVLSVSERAQAYEEAGASAISVLCDGPFFDGSYEHLQQARERCSLPLLCKEFVVDECQLDAATAYGASAVLLIVRILPDRDLSRLIAAANARDLVPLVEIHNQAESKRAIDAGAKVIGVNARDLDTLEMDAERATKVLSDLPQDVVAAHLSGVKAIEDVQQVARGRADAALIGEILMRQDNPRKTLAAFRSAAETGRIQPK